jgi:alpha-beta hydrolase superfamily lysophospholipase
MDLEAAFEYAVLEGAADVVLVGYGMGGAITSTFVRESEWGERVIGMVLDAPLLDGGVVVDEAVADDDVPGFVVALSKGLAALRYGVDWGDRDHIRHAEEFEIPILLFHGTDDEQIPVRSSDRFVEAAAELVRYERIEGAGHGESWNVAASRYEAALRTFLIASGRGPTDLDPPDPETLEELRREPELDAS